MRHLASALVFIACLGWIAAAFLTRDGQMEASNWVAVLGASFAFFGAVGK